MIDLNYFDFEDTNYNNKDYKFILLKAGKISCGFCKYNKHENKKCKNQRNWKSYRLTQYKNKEYVYEDN